MPLPASRKPPRLLPLAGLLLAVLLALSPGRAPAADTLLLLRNGDRLTGRIVQEDASRLTLTNDLLGLLTLPLDAIRERQPASPPAPEAANADRQRRLDDARAAFVTGQLSTTEYHRLLARLQATPADPAGTRADSRAQRLTGEIQAGLDLGLATKDRQLYSGRARLQHAWGPLRNAADYLFTYGRADGELNANRMDGTIKSDFDLREKVYAYNQANGGYDEVRKLDNYWQIGPGMGWRTWRSPHFALSLEGGFNFQEQNRSDGTRTDVFYYRLAQLGRWAINNRLSLDQKLEFFPEWDDLTEYKVRLEGNLRLWLYGNLSLNLTLIDFYDTMAAPGVEPNDLQMRSTLGVSF